MARILIIEDDAEMQHFIGHILFQEGYATHYAWNGKEGYEKILELDPDLILLDLMLPMMNGVELLKKLQDNKVAQGIPIIIVTAYGDGANMLKNAVEVLGAASYLRQPIRGDELVSSVKQALARFPRAMRGLPSTQPKELRKGCIRADARFMSVWINDSLVATLSNKEFALFVCLMEAPGPATREQLLRALGYQQDQGDALKQIVHRLREAFGPKEKSRIKTTPEGYELIA